MIKDAHARILLAVHGADNVEMCETCAVAEGHLGATSMGVHLQDLSVLSQLFTEAEMRFNAYQKAKTAFVQWSPVSKQVLN